MRARWHILGAGAIGCLWAANLKASGADVSLILRDTQKLNTFNHTQGVLLQSTHYAVDAELPDNPSTIHQLLLTTKSIDTVSAINSIRHRLAENARIIVLQNGLGPQQWVHGQFTQADVAWASTTDGAWVKSPFEVVLAGKGITKIGKPTGVIDWLEPLGAGFLNIEIDDDIENTLWLKLAINCAINPLTAIYGCKNGELIKNPDYFTDLLELCHEIEAVANAADITLFDDPLIEHVTQVATLTAENFSSMMQDVKHQRLTEIETITGFLCDKAHDLKIAVPKNTALYEKIKSIESGYRITP